MGTTWRLKFHQALGIWLQNLALKNRNICVRLYLFYAVNFHVGVGVHPAMAITGHRRGALFNSTMTTIAHKANHGYDDG